MSEPKKVNGSWKVDFYPAGKKGPRKRGTFPTKSKALEFKNAMIARYQKPEDWEKQKQDNRRMSELAEIWYDLLGRSLQDGEKRYTKLIATIDRLGDPIARNLTTNVFATYRAKRIDNDNLTKAAVNREHAYVRAMYNKLIGIDAWNGPNPIASLQAFDEEEAELTYYNAKELKILFRYLHDSRSKHVAIVAQVCLATGARWSEAETLSIRKIKDGRIQFTKTKNSKIRFVPIQPWFEEKLRKHTAHSKQRLFSNCYQAFETAVKKSGLPSPKGQLTHVLRHSFAVHIMEAGGSLVDLMHALGHKEITTTAIYLRFSPKHLKAIPKLNPLTTLNQKGDAKGTPT